MATANGDSDDESSTSAFHDAETCSELTPREPDSDSDVESKDENSYQGPHNWRKGLKPVRSPMSPESTPFQSPRMRRERRMREDKGDDGRTRERVKGSWRKEFMSRTKGIMGNKMSYLTPQNLNMGSTSPSTIKRRHSFHSHLDTSFCRNVINKPISPGVPRKKQGQNATKIPISDKKLYLGTSPGMIRKNQSTSSLAEGGQVGRTELATKKRVEKVLKARLYLLQQMGPNSFLIGGDSPDHKYRVIIGPQRCSCTRGPHCVHILFVMLRVFQVSENDPCLWSKTLKNYEVETLFTNFHARRTLRVQELMKKKAAKPRQQKEQSPDDVTQSAQNSEHEDDEGGSKEEDTCPICLLEMVEGESLVECESCQNRLHHHCIAIWFEECRQQNETLNCPLCRAKWKREEGTCAVPPPQEGLPVPPNTRVSSPQPAVAADGEGDIRMPHPEPIPQEHRATASKWIPVIGEEISACLFSKNWVIREIGLKQLGRMATGALLLGVGEGRTGVVLSPTRQASTHSMLDVCCSVLAYIAADPVYKVFVAALRTLHTVLSYTPCRDSAQQQRLQDRLRPVVHTILWKCADSNRRTSQLSVSALQELVKDKDGELAVGKEIVNPGLLGLGGVAFLVTCITDDYDRDTVQWQWLLGRFYMLDKLLEEYPADFMVRPFQEDLGHGRQPFRHYDRVFHVLRFAKPALSFNHSKVSKMARRVFYMTSRLQAHNRAVLKEISDLLVDVETSIQVHIRRRLWRVAEEYDISQQAKEEEEEGGRGGGVGGGGGAGVGLAGGGDAVEPLPPFTTPVISAASTPRSTSPLTLNDVIPPGSLAPPPPPPAIVLPQHHVAAAPGLVFPPTIAPPNSPNHRLGRKRNSNSVSSVTTTTSSQVETESVVSSAAASTRGEGSDSESGGMTPPPTPQKPPPTSRKPNSANIARNADSHTLTSSPYAARELEEVEADADLDGEGEEGEEEGVGSPLACRRVMERQPLVEVADACVATSPSLRLRGLTLGVQAFGSEPSSPQEVSPRPQGDGASDINLLNVSDLSPVLEDPHLEFAQAQADYENVPHPHRHHHHQQQPDHVAGIEQLLPHQPHHSAPGGAQPQQPPPPLACFSLPLTNPVSTVTALSLAFSSSVPALPQARPPSHSPSLSPAAAAAPAVSPEEEPPPPPDLTPSPQDSEEPCCSYSEDLVLEGGGAESADTDGGLDTEEELCSSANATVNTSRAALLTEDLSDLALTPSRERVSFKEEIAARSPHGSPTITTASDADCHCKEEVEKEEAQALVEALERSTLAQDALPRVPGLSRSDKEELITIHIQDEQDGSKTSQYQEGVHWTRGGMLGTGAFSTCYQARDAKTGTLMAVKQISFCRNSLSEQEKVVEAVRDEIEMMAKLYHPNIVRILGATQQGCHFFMFVEWMPGNSVSFLLDRYGCFSEQVVTSYTFQILNGLAYLHDNHILHRDLKGANLLVDSTGQRVRIGDFGASARLASRQTGAGEFQGQLLGTIAFMAPEVLRGESYGRSCDIWCVGCVMIEMITSKPPWGAHDLSNHLALIFKIASTTRPPPIPDQQPPAIRDLLLRCLEVNREERPPAKELLKHPLFTMYTAR